MRVITFIITALCFTFITYGQDHKLIKGVAIERTGTPIPYCNVSVKGTKIAVMTNNCGEFELPSQQDRFTIVFNCMYTHDFITFERSINPKEMHNEEIILFQLKKHNKIQNAECKKKFNKKLRKVII